MTMGGDFIPRAPSDSPGRSSCAGRSDRHANDSNRTRTVPVATGSILFATQIVAVITGIVPMATAIIPRVTATVAVVTWIVPVTTGTVLNPATIQIFLEQIGSPTVSDVELWGPPPRAGSWPPMTAAPGRA